MRSLYFFLRPKFFVCLNLLTHTHFSLQGLILSNALRAQKDAEDEGCVMALSNLRSEVIELRNEGLEKDKILHSLINKIKEDEAAFKGQAEAQKREIEDLRKQLARAKEERILEETRRELSDQWADHLEVTVEELRSFKKRCYNKSIECVKKLKGSFLEKDKILHSLINKIKEDEAAFKGQAEAQKREIENLRKQLARAKEERILEETKRELSDQWADHLEGTVEELRSSKKRCYNKSIECVKKLKLASPGSAHSQAKKTSQEAIPKVPSNGSTTKLRLSKKF